MCWVRSEISNWGMGKWETRCDKLCCSALKFLVRLKFVPPKLTLSQSSFFIVHPPPRLALEGRRTRERETLGMRLPAKQGKGCIAIILRKQFTSYCEGNFISFAELFSFLYFVYSDFLKTCVHIFIQFVVFFSQTRYFSWSCNMDGFPFNRKNNHYYRTAAGKAS